MEVFSILSSFNFSLEQAQFLSTNDKGAFLLWWDFILVIIGDHDQSFTCEIRGIVDLLTNKYSNSFNILIQITVKPHKK